MQAVHALDQSLAVTGQSRLADRAAIAFQRLQQHAEHVVCEVCLARGQAQTFLLIEHLEALLRC